MSNLKNDKIKFYCLNGIGKDQNFLWRNRIFSFLVNNNVHICYDYKIGKDDEIEIIKRYISKELINNIDLASNNNYGVFICDTIDNISEHDNNILKNTIACLFGGFRKYNYDEQMLLIERNQIKIFFSDLFPDELIENKCNCTNYFVQNFNFIEPEIPANCENDKTQKKENLIISIDENNSIKKIFIKALVRSGYQLIRIDSKSKLNINEIDPNYCKKILFIGKSQNFYHAVLKYSYEHKIFFKPLEFIKLSYVRKLHLIQNGIFIDKYNNQFETSKKSIRSNIHSILKQPHVNSIEHISEINNQNNYISIDSFRKCFLETKDFDFKCENYYFEIADYLFFECNYSIYYFETKIVFNHTKSNEFNKLLINDIISNLILKISHITNNHSQYHILSKIISYDNKLFYDNLKRTLNLIPTDLKDNLFKSIIETIITYKLKHSKIELILNLLQKNTNNVLLNSRINLLLHTPKEFIVFFNSLNDQSFNTSKTYALTTSLIFYFKYNYDKLDNFDSNLYSLVDLSDDSHDSINTKFLCHCLINISKNDFQSLNQLIENYTRENSKCTHFNGIIIEIIFHFLNHGDLEKVKILLDFVKLELLTDLDLLGYISIHLILNINIPKNINYDINFSKDMFASYIQNLHSSFFKFLLYAKILFFVIKNKNLDILESQISLFDYKLIKTINVMLHGHMGKFNKCENLNGLLERIMHFIKLKNC